MIEDERPDAPDEQPADAEGDAEQPAEEPAADAEAPAEEPAADAAPDEETPAEEPAAEEPAAEEPAAEEPAAEPPAEEPAAEEPAAEEPSAEGEPAAEAAEERPRKDKRKKGDEKKDKKKEEEVIPGAHLAPDLVLEPERPEGEELEDRYAQPEGDAADGEAPAEGADEPAAEPTPRSALDLAADARYRATGKRKTAVARVILKPGDGNYAVNGRSLEDFFPRAALQKAARQPLEVAGFERRMDVVARIHGGGVSAQAGALRHGVARALVEADPALRPELKRRGLLTRDARAKERKKAGLKKARKRPQFSKR
jgi:small subunit ribosomal protein S9